MPNFIKYRDSEQRNILNGNVHRRTGSKGAEKELQTYYLFNLDLRYG